jgi:alpha-tubulin suppressor-like RCC1 family protein
MGLTSGLCSYPTNGCGTASCSGTQFVATGTCNGNGSCAFPAAQNCSGGYVCSASACKTSCTADADCLSGNFCESGICHPTAISIEAGQSTVCVVLSDATARCWGANGSGELGTGAVTSSSATPVKVAVVSGPIKAMSTGSDFNCALLQSGAIWCWGFNGNGQLGNGTTSGTVILSPTSAVLTNLNLGATQLAAGQTSSCALLTDGSVQCWGQNNYGQLGTGSFTLTQSPTPLTVSVGAGTVTQLSVTSGSAFALINSAGQNNLVSWGENNYGELGLDTITSASPAGVPTPSAAYTNIGAIALSDYSYFQCMLSTSGIPTCFGQGYSDLPTSITGWAGAAVQLADGDQTCALLSGSTGVVTCWPAAGSATAVTLPMPATKVVVGYTYACAILKNGSVWCWGDDSLGELGNGNFNSSTTPVQVLGW